ncbi:MAG: DUF1616 domain-containing protein [Nitrososphaerales archaeon]
MVRSQIEHLEQNELLQKMIVDVMRKQTCRTVNDVVIALRQLDHGTTFEEIRDAISELKRDGKIVLSEPRVKGSFLNYIANIYRSGPFWLTLIVSLLVVTTIYSAPQTDPWSTIRIFAGSAFVLFIPGYALTQLLFPTKDMNPIEYIAMSVGLSLAITPLIGLILNYSMWGIRLDPIVTSISAISIIMSTIATYKKFIGNKPDSLQ